MAAMSSERFGPAAIFTRVLFSLFIVFATYNPSGRSYVHWAVAEGALLPRLIVGLILLAVYTSLLFATWEVIGFTGMFLVSAISASLALWFGAIGLIDLSDSGTFGVTVCIVVSMVIAWGMSFAFLFGRLTGIIHTRGSIH